IIIGPPPTDGQSFELTGRGKVLDPYGIVACRPIPAGQYPLLCDKNKISRASIGKPETFATCKNNTRRRSTGSICRRRDVDRRSCWDQRALPCIHFTHALP